jgi:hypothetical protein
VSEPRINITAEQAASLLEQAIEKLEIVTAENEHLKEMLREAREALNWYAEPSNSEEGRLLGSDLAPVQKISGRLISHYSEPPIVEQVWSGGQRARYALARIDEIVKGNLYKKENNQL